MASRTSRRRKLSLSGGGSDSISICKLCKGHHSHLSSPAEWKNEQARTYVLSLDVPSASLVCRPCRHDVTRALANPCYVPRWRKDASKASTKSSDCCVATCSNTVFQVLWLPVKKCNMHLTALVWSVVMTLFQPRHHYARITIT